MVPVLVRDDQQLESALACPSGRSLVALVMLSAIFLIRSAPPGVPLNTPQSISTNAESGRADPFAVVSIAGTRGKQRRKQSPSPVRYMRTSDAPFWGMHPEVVFDRRFRRRLRARRFLRALLELISSSRRCSLSPPRIWSGQSFFFLAMPVPLVKPDLGIDFGMIEESKSSMHRGERLETRRFTVATSSVAPSAGRVVPRNVLAMPVQSPFRKNVLGNHITDHS